MKTIQTIVFELQGKSFFAELLLFSKKCLLIFVHLSNTSRGYPRISNNHISEHKRPPGSRSMDSHNTPNAFGVIYFGRPIVFFIVWHGMTGASFGAFGVLNRLQPLDPWRENVETEMTFFPWAKSICSTYELQKEFGALDVHFCNFH